MPSKNPPATNAVLQPVSCTANATYNHTANIVTVIPYRTSSCFYLNKTIAINPAAFVENLSVQGFAWMKAIGDKLAEDKMGEEKFGKGNLYGRSIKGTSLAMHKPRGLAVLTTGATINQVGCKPVLGVKANNFSDKNQQKNLPEINTVVIGKNTS